MSLTIVQVVTSIWASLRADFLLYRIVQDVPVFFSRLLFVFLFFLLV